MTTEQWLFEYKALHARELQEKNYAADMARAQFKALRDTLIGVLGLDFGEPKTEEETAEEIEKGLDPETPKFIPASILLGNPEVIQHFLKRAQRRQSEESAAKDEQFDAFSDELHKQLRDGTSHLPGDMIPLLTDDLKDLEHNSYWRSEDAQATLLSLGVKPRVGGSAAPHVASRPKVMEDRQGSMLDERALALAGEKVETGRIKIDISDIELERYRKALQEEDESADG